MNRPDFSVADLGELVTLITTDLVEGANVWVDTDGAYWTLEKNSGVAPGPTVLAPLPGAPQAGASNARWIREAGAGGGVTGDPNSILFENPTGTNAITDPKLVAAPVDQFGRPQIRDWRTGANVFPDDGPVYRQGAWQTDGDPTNQNSQGVVLYGANSLGIGPSALGGGYARIKPRRIGLAQIIPAVNGGALFYPIRFDTDSVDGAAFLDDFAVAQFRVARSTGVVVMGSPDATHGGNGALYINQLGPLGGSTSPVQMSQVTKSSAIRLAQYGAIAATANVGFFRSRGATIGALASCNVGDSLMNLTASGVCSDGVSVPLAAIFDATIPATGLFASSIAADFRWQLARDVINSRRVVWTMQGMTGDLIMGPKAASATQEGRIRVKEGVNAMQGMTTTGPGGTIVVPNTLITANTRIALTWQDGGSAPLGTPWPRARTLGVDFTIQSTNVLDVGVNVFWQLWEPAP